jgi:hypothetical protein
MVPHPQLQLPPKLPKRAQVLQLLLLLLLPKPKGSDELTCPPTSTLAFLDYEAIWALIHGIILIPYMQRCMSELISIHFMIMFISVRACMLRDTLQAWSRAIAN